MGKVAPVKQDEEPTKPGVGPVRRRGLHFKIGMAADGGHTIEVMHAAAEQADITLHGDCLEIGASTVALDDAAAPSPRWNQIAKVGTFRGHPAGPFSLTPAIFDEIVRNYRDIDGGNVAFDYEHCSEADETAGSIPTSGAPAQGWIRQLENRGIDGLWGLVDWLEPARTYIREGKYRFLSPAIRFGAKHPVSGTPIGARLTSVAMTNKPFLRSLQPLLASDQKLKDSAMLQTPLMSHHQSMPTIRTALKLHELATAADCKDTLGKLRECCSMGQGPGSQVMGVNLDDYINPLKGLMNLGANATVEDLLDAVEDLIESALAQHVDEFHSEDGPNMTDGSGDAAMKETTNMTDTVAVNDLAVKLGEEKSRADRAVNESAGLSLRLKDAEATAVSLADKVKATEAIVGEREATIVSLKADIQKRDDDASTARVEDAFVSYKDVKKLTDDDKTAMKFVLRSDPTLFDKLYPRVAPNHQHLLRDLTTGRTPNGSTAPGQAKPLPVSMSSTAGAGNSQALFVTLKDKYLKDGLEPEEAFKRAIRESRASH